MTFALLLGFVHRGAATPTTSARAWASQHPPSIRTEAWNESFSGQSIRSSTISGVTGLRSQPSQTYHSVHRANLTTLGGNTTTEYIPDYEEYCRLWNSSCSGDLQAAFDKYEANIAWQEGNACYMSSLSAACTDPPCIDWMPQTECNIDGSNVPETSKLAFSEMSAFARSPKCTSMYEEKHCVRHSAPEISCLKDLGPIGPCCGRCFIPPAVVDLYYWPVENSDTSCLSIIGDSARDPNFDATTQFFTTTALSGTSKFDVDSWLYWGCTTLSTAHNGSIIGEYLTTASQKILDTLTYKFELYDPWQTWFTCVPTVNEATAVRTVEYTVTLQARAHSLINTTEVPGRGNQTAAQIAISNGVTL